MQQNNTPRDFDDAPETPSKSRFKFSFKFPVSKKTSPKVEKKSFTDELATRCEVTAVTPEAEQAYNLLVAKGSPESGNMMQLSRSMSYDCNQVSLSCLIL